MWVSVPLVVPPSGAKFCALVDTPELGVNPSVGAAGPYT